MLERSESRSKPGLFNTLVRVGGHICYERLARPVPRRADDIPCRIDAITPEWLTAVLCRHLEGAEILACTFGPESAGTSVRRQISLQYNCDAEAAGLPRSIFAKATPTLLTRMSNGFAGTMVPEANFYRSLRSQIAVEAPFAYHTAYDERSFRSIFLFNDLSATKGAMFCTPEMHISRRQAQEMVELLADVHGRFHGDAGLEARHTWLRPYPEWFTALADGLDIQYYHRLGAEAADGHIAPEILRRAYEIWPAMLRSLRAHERYPRTLVHNDVHLGNWYLTGPGHMGLCDWQCVGTGIWARDIAYALAANLTVEDRRNWETDLLRHYLERLRSKYAVDIPFNEAFRLYRQQIVAALVMWLMTLRHSPMLPTMQPEDVCLEMIQRISTAMADLNSLDSLGD